MIQYSVNIELREDGQVLVYTRDSESTTQELRPVNDEMLVHTRLPNARRAGALCVNLLERQMASFIDIWLPGAQTHWVAEARLDSGEARRGKGSTPVEALTDLVYNCAS